MKVRINEKNQAVAPATVQMESVAFEDNQETAIYWLGNAGVMVNSHGTNIMIDPLLDGFDMPSLIEVPIQSAEVPGLDGLLLTHCDNDHFSKPTCLNLKSVTKMFHGPNYVKTLLDQLDLPGVGHDINSSFAIGTITVTLTPAKHNWQNESSKYSFRHFDESDYCGYWLDTPDGTIWLPGDSKLLHPIWRCPNPMSFCLIFPTTPGISPLKERLNWPTPIPKAS